MPRKDLHLRPAVGRDPRTAPAGRLPVHVRGGRTHLFPGRRHPLPLGRRPEPRNRLQRPEPHHQSRFGAQRRIAGGRGTCRHVLHRQRRAHRTARHRDQRPAGGCQDHVLPTLQRRTAAGRNHPPGAVPDRQRRFGQPLDPLWPGTRQRHDPEHRGGRARQHLARARFGRGVHRQQHAGLLLHRLPAGTGSRRARTRRRPDAHRLEQGAFPAGQRRFAEPDPGQYGFGVGTG